MVGVDGLDSGTAVGKNILYMVENNDDASNSDDKLNGKITMK